jgi:hypothetical protein
MNPRPTGEVLRKHPGGRPRVNVTSAEVRQLREEGCSWRQIAEILGIGTATAMRRYDAERRSLEASQNSPWGGGQ